MAAAVRPGILIPKLAADNEIPQGGFKEIEGN
jgi:hypothetical protein